MFDLAANGGGLVTLTFEKTGFLTSQRAVQTPWRDYVWAPAVTLVPLDSTVTTVDLTSSNLQIARGSAVTDEDGTRQARVVVKPGTQAGMLVNGQSQPVTSLNIRATEYTVGKAGPSSMPGQLPPSSGYTYAVELSADEAIAAGATSVTFNQPLVMYVDNFLGFPVGGAVPTGYYDRERGLWVASKNGRVIQVLGVVGGKAALDVDGDGQPDSGDALTSLGIDDQELAQIGAEFAAGKSLWRVEISHFTPWDCNWPYGPPLDAVPPPDQDTKPEVDNPEEECGSIIGCEDQTLGEALPIAGTPLMLHHKSDRTPGRRGKYSLSVRLSAATVPASLVGIRVAVGVAGRVYQAAYAPAPNLTYSMFWDGKDAYGRRVQGPAKAAVTVYYDYVPQYYAVRSEFENSFARAEATGANVLAKRDASIITLSRSWARSLTGSLGAWDARGSGLDGWSLDVYHVYDFTGPRLLLGNGSERSMRPYDADVISTLAGTAAPQGGDGLYEPGGVAVGPDGSLFIADTWHDRIRRIAPDGTATTVAGTGTRGYSGDGGPATAAALDLPSGVAVGTSGMLFIADSGNFRIRRVGPDGNITTVAGTGAPFADDSGDGGPATAATLSASIVAVSSDGSLFITGSNRVRRVGPDGIITTVAGTGTRGNSGDGGPAIAATFSSPTGVALGPDGSLFITDWPANRVRRVGPDGVISTVAGGGTADESVDGIPATTATLNRPLTSVVGSDGSLFIACDNGKIRRVQTNGIITTFAGQWAPGSSGDGGPATAATIEDPVGLAASADASLFLTDWGNDGSDSEYRIRVVGPAFPQFALGDFDVASEDGSEVYQFSGAGRHLKTLDVTTGVVRYLFGYDANGYLTSITDASGNVTTIERTGSTATAIVAPFGQRTVLSVNSDGWLTALTDPAGLTRTMDYSADGLLQHFTDPLGHIHSFTYDDAGRLIKDENPAGGSTSLARTEQATGYTVATSTALGRTHVYQVESLTTGAGRRTTTDSSGANTVTVTGTDGSEQTTYADGSTVLVKKGPDPRWGMVAPIAQSVVKKTPAGLTSSVSATRTATLSDLGNPWSMTKLTDAVSVNGKNWVTSYDASTRKVTTKSSVGRQSVVTLDEKGRAVKTEMPGLAAVTMSYDEHGRPATVAQGDRQTALAYDAQGNLSSMTDPLSRVIALQSDAVGRLLKQTGPDGATTTFRYDANSNILGLTPPGRTEYGFGYTPVDLESSFTPPSVGTWNPATNYAYDEDKALTSVARPDGVTVTTTYDAAGRVSEVDHPQGPIKFGYSPTTGQIISAQTPEESLAYSYDGSLLTGVAWRGAVAGSVGYVYDNNFRVVSTTVNGANAASRGYDDDGLLTSVGALSMTRDSSNGLLTGTSVGTGAGAVSESYGYNAFGEATSYSANVGSNALLSIQYTRDALGRIREKVETIEGTATTYDYGYDASNRLAEVKKDGVVVRSWTYDAAGNRTSATESGATVSATYDAQDRMLTCETTSYTYGNAGDLQSRTSGTQSTSFAYDALGNLVSAQLPDGTQISYSFDAQGRRVGKLRNGQAGQSFLWESGLRIAAELDAAGNVVSRFVYGGKVNVPELIIKSGATYRVVADHLGSPRFVINTADGTVAQRMEYDDWGSLMSDSNPGFQPFGFAGGLYDRDTGLVRFGARDYDSQTGRWTSIDPLRFRGGEPNLFVYAANNPMRFVDPNGLFVIFTDAASRGYGDALRGSPSGAALLDYRDASPNLYFVSAVAGIPGTSATTYGAAGNLPGETGHEFPGGMDIRLFHDRVNPCSGESQASNLGHELGHAAMYDYFTTGRTADFPDFLQKYLPFTLPGQPNGMEFIPHNMVYGPDMRERWGGL